MRNDVKRSVLSVMAVALTAWFSQLVDAVPPNSTSPYDAYKLRTTIALPGAVHDFKAAYLPGGHADFMRAASAGAGRYVYVMGDTLGSAKKPVFNSAGYKRSKDWSDSALRPIIPTKSYIDARSGDIAGAAAGSTGNAAGNAASVAQWFQDAAGVNTAYTTQMTMNYNGVVSAFVFDGTLDGYRANGTSDYTYTCESSMPFLYEQGQGWYVSAGTNADCWVYVDDRLVIDGGGGMGAQGMPGVATDGPITLSNTGQVNIDAGSAGSVATNTASAAAVSLGNSSKILADVYAGPGSNPASAISAGAGAITGVRGSLSAPIAMPQIDPPSGMPASIGDKDYKNTTATISANTHFNNLTIEVNSTVNISGNVVILVDGAFTLRNSSKIILLGNSTLEVYFKGAWFAGQSSEINVTTTDPGRVTFYNLGTSLIDVNNSVDAYANFASPGAGMSIGNSVHVRGNFIGKSFDVNNTGDFTIKGSSGWGHFHENSAMDMAQRIDLDRLGWLDPAHTHYLHIFFANRTGRASHLRLETNMTLLRVAGLPQAPNQTD